MPTSSSLAMLEPMQVDPAAEDNDNNGGQGQGQAEDSHFVVENPSLDLETYVQGYSGMARLQRLIFIADCCPTLSLEALKLAMAYVVETFNTALFLQLRQRLKNAMNLSDQSMPMASSNLPDLAVSSSAGMSNAPGDFGIPGFDPSGASDSVWVEQRSKKAALKLEKLDTDLKNYKSNAIKESIRRGHDDLGDHYLDCGDLQNALKAYSRARDYCTNGRHVTNMCLNVIKVSVYLQNWSHVVSYVNKALATPDFAEGSKTQDNIAILTRLNCAHGLADLACRRYRSAAKHFLNANLDHCDLPDMMSAQNVATYGGLCALATFDRNELQKCVLNSPRFKLFLELDPQLRDILLSFYQSKYGKCLKLLNDIKDNLRLDLYLSEHVEVLYINIRNRGLVQYFSPYLSADLRLMANCFNTSLSSLEDELTALILEGQIQARIDSHNKVLYAQDIDQRTATFEKALDMGALYQRRAKLLILRSALLKNQVVVKAPVGQK